jgi:hypothetical protein
MRQYGVHPPIFVRFFGDAAETTDCTLWICPNLGCNYLLTKVQFAYGTAGGASAACMPEKCQSTEAVTAGDDLLSTALDLDTVVADTVTTGALVTNVATLTFNPGDRLCLDFSGTVAGIVGLVIEFIFEPVESGL